DLLHLLLVIFLAYGDLYNCIEIIDLLFGNIHFLPVLLLKNGCKSNAFLRVWQILNPWGQTKWIRSVLLQYRMQHGLQKGEQKTKYQGPPKTRHLEAGDQVLRKEDDQGIDDQKEKSQGQDRN